MKYLFVFIVVGCIIWAGVWAGLFGSGVVQEIKNNRDHYINQLDRIGD
jgi:hypothetical protein